MLVRFGLCVVPGGIGGEEQLGWVSTGDMGKSMGPLSATKYVCMVQCKFEVTRVMVR